ncbi:guanine nucleotide-binding protein G(I)/G(S)/G(O) subunit gamma-11 isoform X1 [Sarcophilus harrisii]|uniref:guanine nucleotide-binding protein G(I)/G(S)/G(O) subunit gamma-11 isoform X1 n=1 Tax=Sarcophilus harrisii TaxID=9305 RepID=UPI001301B550|nr:guanine nucleotide-binding protein G(I)/G(S)/G(O) subunit gamma-11 isoform X1 [Sarcophilus harrisii]
MLPPESGRLPYGSPSPAPLFSISFFLLDCRFEGMDRLSRCLQVSKCSEEIKKYIEARCGEDPLVKGIPEDKNPYKEKAGCTVS